VAWIGSRQKKCVSTAMLYKTIVDITDYSRFVTEFWCCCGQHAAHQAEETRKLVYTDASFYKINPTSKLFVSVKHNNTRQRSPRHDPLLWFIFLLLCSKTKITLVYTFRFQFTYVIMIFTQNRVDNNTFVRRMASIWLSN